jgi:terminase small subunit-like protein
MKQQPNKPKLTIVGADSASSTSTSPPRPLGEHGRELWNSIVREYAVDDTAGRELLAHACSALDRAEECAAEVARDGAVIRFKNGGVKEHPALRGELACRSFVVRTLTKLGLTEEPLKSVGRPAGKFYPDAT